MLFTISTIFRIEMSISNIIITNYKIIPVFNNFEIIITRGNERFYCSFLHEQNADVHLFTNKMPMFIYSRTTPYMNETRFFSCECSHYRYRSICLSFYINGREHNASKGCHNSSKSVHYYRQNIHPCSSLHIFIMRIKSFSAVHMMARRLMIEALNDATHTHI